MKQIMNYIEESINYENRLRYIAANILEICLFRECKPNIHINGLEDKHNNSGRNRLDYDHINNILCIDIFMTNNIKDMYYNNAVLDSHKNLNKFLYNILDNKKDVSVWIFILLHELGHVKFVDDIIHLEGYDALARSCSYEEVSINNLRMIITPITYFNEDYCYYNSGIELFADKFAYSNFYYIWNELVNRGLI